MSDSEIKSQRALTRTISETLDTIVAPYVRQAIVDDALRTTGRSTLPSDRRSLQRFVEGPLRAAAERALGRELAGSLVDEIQRAFVGGDARRSTLPQFRRQSPPPSSRPSPDSGASRYSTVPPERSSVPTARSPIPPPPAAQSSPPSPAAPPSPAPLPEASLPRQSPVSTPPPASHRPSPPPPPSSAPFSTDPSPDPPPMSQSYVRRQEPRRVPTPPVTPSEYFRRVALTRPDRAAVSSPLRTQAAVRARVLVATHDTELLSTLSSWLGDTASVTLVRSVFAVLHAVEDHPTSKLVVVLDCEQPSIRPAALAALADDLIDTQVVLFRTSADIRRTAIAISPTVKRWMIFESRIAARHVAEHCLQLVS